MITRDNKDRLIIQLDFYPISRYYKEGQQSSIYTSITILLISVIIVIVLHVTLPVLVIVFLLISGIISFMLIPEFILIHINIANINIYNKKEILVLLWLKLIYLTN